MPHSRRDFVVAAGAALAGAKAPSAATASAPLAGSAPPEPSRVFDAHLHCPAESGELWQWHTVTRTFGEFVAYLDRTGVQRGIMARSAAASAR